MGGGSNRACVEIWRCRQTFMKFVGETSPFLAASLEEGAPAAVSSNVMRKSEKEIE